MMDQILAKTLFIYALYCWKGNILEEFIFIEENVF